MISRKKFSDLDSYPATKAALKDKLGITNLEENQVTGVQVYSTYAELPNPGTPLVSYKISNDPDTALNGYYHWDGADYVKDASLANGVVEEGNADATSGGTVYDAVKNKADGDIESLKAFTDTRSDQRLTATSFYVADVDFDIKGVQVQEGQEVRLRGKLDKPCFATFRNAFTVDSGSYVSTLFENTESSGTEVDVDVVAAVPAGATWVMVSKSKLLDLAVYEVEVINDVVEQNRAEIVNVSADRAALVIQSNNAVDSVKQDVSENDAEQTIKLNTSENTLWDINSDYDFRGYGVWYKMIADDILFNVVKIPLPKNRADVDLIGDITVRIALNGEWVHSKTIKNADLVAWGINTLNRPTSDSMYFVDIPMLRLNTDDILFVAWSCDNPADSITFQYDNNDATGTHYADRYNRDFNTTGVEDFVEVPDPSTRYGSWTFPVICLFVDYTKQKIIDEGGSKPAISNVFPDKVYSVCDDIDQGDAGFKTRNYANMLYVDHLFKLSQLYSMNWEKTGDDKLPLFAPIAADGSSYNGGVDVLTTPVSEKIKGQIQEVTVAFDHVSTKSSLGELEFPKVLFIGDSVTGAFLANRPNYVTDNNPTAYWSYIKKMFFLDYLANGSSGHSMLSMGVDDSRTFDVEGNTVKAYAEGKGGWNTRDFLYEKDFAVDGNRFYDSAKGGLVKFSVVKYLERYKTLADDGVTRLTVGVDAGTEVTDVNAYDVCTPTHIVIQHGFNDVEANWSGDIDLMIAEIKAEFPNVIIIVSTIDASGTYFPEKYPMFDKDGVNMLGDSLHEKMYNLVAAAKAKDDPVNKVFYCPSYFVQPTAWGVPFREVNRPEYLADPTRQDFIYKVEQGAGANYHPNTFAHSAWAYQIYSLLKYTLTL